MSRWVEKPEEKVCNPGLAAVTLLEWSPDGECLLAGLEDGGFQIWETQRWTTAVWRTEVMTAALSEKRAL